MSDDIDRSQEAEDIDRAQALHRALKVIEARSDMDGPSRDGMCIDCDDPIEPERLAALRGKTSRCSSCAHDLERALRGRP
ncbi:MAG: TraR/DksA C4-type zinc finger protein [Luteibacter sp.]